MRRIGLFAAAALLLGVGAADGPRPRLAYDPMVFAAVAPHAILPYDPAVFALDAPAAAYPPCTAGRTDRCRQGAAPRGVAPVSPRREEPEPLGM